MSASRISKARGARTYLGIGSLMVAIAMLSASAATASAATWTIQSTPSPSIDSQLNAVSCPSASVCFAAGEDTEHWEGVGQIYENGEWTAFPEQEFSGQLKGISCNSVNSCFVVGTENGAPAAERWLRISGQWIFDIHSPPTPAGGSSVVLNDVSCTSASACTAVGTYEHEGMVKPLSERWNGVEWTIQATPSYEYDMYLSGVSCTSASFCMAVGRSAPFATALTLEWDGTAWAEKSGLLTMEPTSLNDVSCVSPTFCMAVGQYDKELGIQPGKTLVASFYGKSWGRHWSPNRGELDNQLNDVSCTSTTACTAVGFSNTTYFQEGPFASESETLVLAWNGTKLAIQETPNPEGFDLPKLLGVSCAAATVCSAVGRAGEEVGLESEVATLAERYE